MKFLNILVSGLNESFIFQASGEDPQCTTPKASRKNDMVHYSHPTTPQNTVPSPGAASINSMHEDYGEISSPTWPRTPASPVSFECFFNLFSIRGCPCTSTIRCKAILYISRLLVSIERCEMPFSMF